MTKNNPNSDPKLTFYISGRISGVDIADARRHFAEAADLLESVGITPVNPFDNGLPDPASCNDHMARDIEMLLPCDGIFMLSDWWMSKGAAIERFTAVKTGKIRLYERAIAMNASVECTEHAQAVERYAHAVCNVMDLPFDDIASPKRDRMLTYARMLFAFRCCVAGMSRTATGGIINRDHSTITYYFNRHDTECATNRAFADMSRRVDEFIARGGVFSKHSKTTAK